MTAEQYLVISSILLLVVEASSSHSFKTSATSPSRLNVRTGGSLLFLDKGSIQNTGSVLSTDIWQHHGCKLGFLDMFGGDWSELRPVGPQGNSHTVDMGRCKVITQWRHLQAGHRVRDHDSVNTATGRQIPRSDGGVERSRDNPPAVWREVHSSDTVRVSKQLSDDFLGGSVHNNDRQVVQCKCNQIGSSVVHHLGDWGVELQFSKVPRLTEIIESD
ncbi:hypothetical protein OGAPHI_006548 [Ogataea philodendri]|uniref:Secreted protein n=1 Tax=Ogataea philodendri TaxID=1378263 RepID=A0A9P8T0E6_9ASCO|nr:uncharacterized protein OGAPHI_006548 [Ogataea philodendri]KAH3661698.1 hypothetical protein OGAPHI_006548 [Ogataea philodendri]